MGGETPLWIAADRGDAAVVSALMSAGASIMCTTVRTPEAMCLREGGVVMLVAVGGGGDK